MSPAKRKPKRHANREGSPWKRGDGWWTARVWPPDGSIETKPRQVYARTRDECVTKRDRLRDELAAAIPAKGDHAVTVGAYLEGWLGETLDQYVRAGDMADSTRDSYRDNARLHILPYLSHIGLRQLTAPMVRQWQDKLLRKTSARTPRKTDGDKPARPAKLSARTVAYCRAILRKALEDAIRDEVAGLERNVVDKVEPPKDRDREDLRMVTVDEAIQIFVAAAADDLWCYWLIAFALGFRRGEGLGMRWADLDVAARVWRPRYQVRRVRGEPDPKTGLRPGKLMLVPLKTRASTAPVALPQYVVDALALWEAQQNGRRATSPAWSDLGLVFTTGVGTAIEPRNINRAWERLCEKAGTRYLRLHDLRHACASYLLAAGVDVKSVQGALRHSRLATTELYLHALEDVPRAAADEMDRVMGRLAPPLPEHPKNVKRRVNAVVTAVEGTIGKAKEAS